jgi:hypothetical protein
MHCDLPESLARGETVDDVTAALISDRAKSKVVVAFVVYHIGRTTSFLCEDFVP